MEENKTIYLNDDLSDKLGLEYNNLDNQTVIHSSALVNAYKEHYGTLPQDYDWLLEISKDLLVSGSGFGWWKVIS